MHANEDVRYRRLLARERPGDDLTIEEFRARDLQQKRMGLNSINQAPETLSLTNDKSIEAYLTLVDQIAGEQDGQDLDVAAGLADLMQVSDVGLQEAILVALLSVWESHETRRFYTTTEVAGLIRRAFPSIRAKHKDNVSRYFNQDFYAFYEISAARNGTRTYRLSNTGYGMAISALRALLRLQ